MNEVGIFIVGVVVTAIVLASALALLLASEVSEDRTP